MGMNHFKITGKYRVI